MAIELGTAYISILPETNKLAAGIKGVMKDSERQADATGRSMGSKMGAGIKSGIKVGFAGAAGVLGAIGGLGIKTAAEFQQISISMETLMGSSQRAKSEMAWLTEKAAITPFELTDLAQADKTLLGFGFTSEKVRRQFLLDMGNMAAAVGLPSERVPDLARVFGQIQASGRASMEDINQLIDAGIPVWDALGKATKMNVADMRKAISDGKIDAETFNGALQNLSQTKFGDAMEKQSKTLSGMWSTLKDNLAIGAMQMVEPFIPLIEDLLPKLSDGIESASGYARKFANFLRADFAPAIKEIAGWMSDNKDALLGVAIGAGIAGVALGAYNAYVRISTAVTKAWAVAQKILNGTMKANPVGLVVAAIAALVAILFIAYKRNEEFRKIVDKVWAGIKKAISVTWNRFIKPALSAFAEFITGTLAPAAMGLWQNVIKPVFSAIGKAIGFAWNNVIKPVFQALFWYFTKVLFPVWRGLWTKVVRPVMTWIGDKISAVWNKGIKPVFSALSNFIEKRVSPAFRKAVNKIGEIWDSLKQKVSAPVRWIIDTVYNKGIVPLVGKVYEWFGAKNPLGPMEFDRGLTGAGSNRMLSRASGGVLPGWSPGRDIHTFYSPTAGGLALSGGEAIMRPEFTRAVGGKKGVDLLNAMARRGLLAYATGGVWPLSPVKSSIQHGSGYSWARWAGDINGPGDDYGQSVRAYRDGIVAAVNEWSTSYGNHIRINHPNDERTLYAHLSSMLVNPGQAVRAGQIIGRVGSTGNSSGPHLHFEIAGGSDPIGVSGVNSRVEAGRWNIMKSGGNIYRALLDTLQSGPGGFIGDIARRTVSMTKEAILQKFPEWSQELQKSVTERKKRLRDAGIDTDDDRLRRVHRYDNGGILEPGAFAYNASKAPEAVFNNKQFREFAQARGGIPRRVDMTITNWNTGEGYFRDVARDEINGEFEFTNTRRRMGR